MVNTHQKKGFTLIEIIIVIVIVGVLAGLVLPRYTYTMERAKAAEGVSLLDAMRKAQLGYRLEFGQYTLTPGNLDVDISESTYFNAPTIGGTVAAPIMSLQRSTGDYTLNMVIDGTITCTGNATFCSALGY